jgi:hypothetical protein
MSTAAASTRRRSRTPSRWSTSRNGRSSWRSVLARRVSALLQAGRGGLHEAHRGGPPAYNGGGERGLVWALRSWPVRACRRARSTPLPLLDARAATAHTECLRIIEYLDAIRAATWRAAAQQFAEDVADSGFSCPPIHRSARPSNATLRCRGPRRDAVSR